MRYLAICAVFFLVTSAPALKKSLRRSIGHDQQIEQNLIVDQYHLRRLKNDSELKEAIEQGTLVPIESSPYLKVSPRLKPSRRYCLTQTLTTVQTLANLYFMRFGQPLIISSAVRTLKDQRHLRLWNRNAAPTTGPEASSHSTGATVDLERRRMTPEQTEFMDRLLYLYTREEKVIFIKEKGQLCYHLFVIPSTTYEEAALPYISLEERQ